MPIRLLVTAIIVFTNLLIIIFSVCFGILLVSRQIKEAQETDMQVIADIADRHISNEIELLHLKVSEVAKDLAMAGESEWFAILAQQRKTYPEFIGLAVFDAKLGRISAIGERPAPSDAMETTHIAGALEGKKKLHTTYFYDPYTVYDPSISTKNPDADRDDVVFYVAVPFPASQERLLAVTIPGTFFREKLLDFTIWDTGHVFMIDTETFFVSNPREHWVYQRGNILRFAEVDPGFTALAETALKMASGDAGIGYYTVYDIPRVCAYKPVSGSEDGWCLGAIAPLPESPFRFVSVGIVATGTIGLFLGIIAAFIGSAFIKKPFDKVAALQKEAELNSQYKSQFLANMSHEMRTPLTSVIGLTELTLRTVHLDEETHGNLVKVYRSGETLLGLINDILDISKIEANKFELNPVEYDLPSMLNDTVTQSVLYVGEKPVEFVLDITDDLPRRLYGDELRVKQVLNNLLSNAFKFTEEGTVTLSVRCEQDGDSVWMTAQVSDTGAGIKPQDFDKLFTLYAKMEGGLKQYDSSRRIEGTGLGLSICKRIVEMMDGTISVESEYGKGSVFTVKIRQEFVDGSTIIENPTIGTDVVESLKKFHYSIDKFRDEEKPRINLSYARVLVVDDNTANLDVAKGLMSLYGMKIDCVTGGRLAIDAIREEKVKYSAIFMDHMMPDIDGIEATQMIREIGTEYARSIPVIALTANAVIGNEEMFLKKGFQAFLAKPIDLTILDNILRQWVRDKEAEARLPDKLIRVGNKPATEPRILSENIPGLDVGKGLAKFVREEVFIEILTSYTKYTRPLLDSIREVTPDNLSDYAIVVHGIKGSSRGIFAETAGDEAEALEMAAKNGDIDFVRANNQRFIQIVSQLVADIENALEKSGIGEKPSKDKPDNALLTRFLAACGSYDIDEMDAAMSEIEKWEYTSDDGLVRWLREKLDQGKYKDITERLSALVANT